jgi:cyanophycinase-like exopeptidase
MARGEQRQQSHKEDVVGTKGVGLMALFGSGETSAHGRRVYEWMMKRLEPPIRAAVLETPAGFQPNSAQVAQKVADFIGERLRNYQPQMAVVPARQRGTAYSPDDPAVVAPVFSANFIFLGPGSPSYVVRQLQGSLAWQAVVARHRLGAGLVLASAATVAIGAYTLPVYEIFKAGLNLHWQPGLDLFGAYGLELVFVPHWDNAEGGAELDTSRCFMGQERFARLLAMLPESATVVGIDEHTALLLDLEDGRLQVMGRGCITLVCRGSEQRCEGGGAFPLAELGDFRRPDPAAGLPAEVWARAQEVPAEPPAPLAPPPEVLALVQEREAARARRDWATSDALRQEIAARGWQVRDTPTGPELTR